MRSAKVSAGDLLAENRRRTERLEANYDPITGKGAPSAGERVKLVIPDFAIPEQWVPEEMLRNTLVKKILNCGSIAAFLSLNPGYTHHDVELQLRRARHKYDFTFWAYCCITIKRKKRLKGQKPRMRFKLNYAQILVLLECEKLRLAGEPIDIIILKARQWGGSTFCIFYQTWILFKWDNAHSFTIAAHEQTASETILNMLRSTIKSYPAWDLGLPETESIHIGKGGSTNHTYVIKDSSENIVFPDGQIYIGTAQNPDSLRGKDIGGAHYSEVPFWPDTPEKRAEDLIADIQGGLSEENPLSMQVIESTAKSEDDFFAHTWYECVAGRGGYTPVFIPWYYIAHDRRVIRNVEAFAQWLIDHREDDMPSGKWKDSGRHYWWLWELGATLEGIYWYMFKRLKQLSYNIAANEMPSTAEEAFTSAGVKVFDRDAINAMRPACRKPRRIGDLVSDAREGEELLQNIRFIEKANGKLWIYEEPDDSPVSNRYVVIMDIGGPYSTSDPYSIRVLDRLMMMPEFAGVPSVVAEMHYHTHHHEAVYDAVRLAKWYGNALLVIESNTLETKDKERDTGGDGSQYILDTAAELYDNLYYRKASGDKIKEGTPTMWGFHTNTKTKPQIIDHMQKCLADQAWDEPNEECLDEASRYINDHGVMTAPSGRHDDILMATAIGLWICYREMPFPQWIEIAQNTNMNTKQPVHAGTF